MENITINTTQNVGINYQIAGLGERYVAEMVDLLIKLIYAFIILSIVLLVVLQNNELADYWFWYLLLYMPMFIYNPTCELLLNGQTIGKRRVKIKVVQLDGTQPTILNYIIRWLFRIFDITLTMGGAATICILFSKYGQRLGDIASKTVVVKIDNEQTWQNIILLPEQYLNYTVTFNNVNALTDADITLINKILSDAQEQQNYPIIDKLANKVKQIIQTDAPQYSSQQFLEIIQKDYYYINSK